MMQPTLAQLVVLCYQLQHAQLRGKILGPAPVLHTPQIRWVLLDNYEQRLDLLEVAGRATQAVLCAAQQAKVGQAGGVDTLQCAADLYPQHVQGRQCQAANAGAG